jgi:transketolase
MKKQFCETVMKLAEKDDRIIFIAGDVNGATVDFTAKYPDRYYNVGLCEQSMISMAAGMALEGLRPIVYSITPFLIERPYEQIKIDIDEQDLPVILVGYADYPTYGPTHRPLDLEGLVKLFKNIVSFFPRNTMETEKAVIEAYLLRKPAIISLKKNDKHII